MHNRGRRRRGIYYPWSIVGLSFLTVGVAFGCRSTFAVFLIPIIEEFHWSRGLTAGVLFLGALVWSLAAPLIGILLDRLGARVLFSLGAVIMALGFIVSSISQNILLFYTGMGVLVALGFAALPMSTHAIVLSNWFVRRRGTAMGIVASGIGIGIFVIVPSAQFLIAQFGWRRAYLALAILMLGFIAPLNATFQCHHPQDVGLSPDSVDDSPIVSTKTRNETIWTLARAFKSYRFWALGLLPYRRYSPAYDPDPPSGCDCGHGIYKRAGSLCVGPYWSFHLSRYDSLGYSLRSHRKRMGLHFRLSRNDPRHCSASECRGPLSCLDALCPHRLFCPWFCLPSGAIPLHRCGPLPRRSLWGHQRSSCPFHWCGKRHRTLAGGVSV